MNDDDFDSGDHSPKHGDLVAGWIVFVILIFIVGVAGNLLGR